ncbi:glycosyltransferase [Treponema sp.]|uniref:glycosyltransferase n=1 Tax=Treponema sp. TaxID=166 RepID=UPI003890513F
MTIALFSDSYLPTKSGIVTVVIQLRDQLIKRGHRVLLVTVETTDEFATDDPDIYRVHSHPLGLGTDQFIAIPRLAPIVEFIKKNNVDLIHCHTEFGIAKAGLHCAKKLHIPSICTTHTMWTDFYKYYLPLGQLIPVKFIQDYMNHFYKQFDSLIGVSTKARNYFKQKGMIPKTPSVIVPNAIDEAKFQQKHLSAHERQKIRKSYGIKDKDIVLLFLGRVAEEKRVFELLNMCQNLVERNSSIKVMFVGNGPAYADMTRMAAKEIEQGKIIFTGFIEWSLVHNFYESSDIFITASLSEMHSMTILEAELSSLPIVVRRDESYMDSVFDGENGFVCDSEDEMEERILELVQDEKLRKKMAARSLELTENFSIENHIKRTLFVYDEVIKNYPKRINDIDVMERMAKKIR